jgi:serine/threonine-protein kinase HipA
VTLPLADEGVGSPDYTTVRRADVYKNGELAAHLERSSAGVEFSYLPAWIGSAGPPVATTLPVTQTPVVTTGGAVPAFFAGLLPEGHRLTALRRSIKTSPDDELSLVLAVGADTIGDVTIVPDGVEPSSVRPRLSVDNFAKVEFRRLLDDLNIHVDRVGIPGVQDKVSLAMLSLPVTRAGHKYLLKLNPPEFPYLVQNEHFFLAAGRSSGLAVAHAELVVDAVGEPGLVVQRFDRITDPQGERSLAVEDGCQVLGLHPEAKYRIPTEDLLAKLCSLCDAPLPAARVFLAEIVFAYVSGNGDAHAKNFSILQDQHGRWGPSPAYDLPSSQPYGDNTLALAVAGKRDGNVPGNRFVALGTGLGLPERAARRVVATIADAVDGWLPGLGGFPFDSARIKKLNSVVTRRQNMLRL